MHTGPVKICHIDILYLAQNQWPHWTITLDQFKKWIFLWVCLDPRYDIAFTSGYHFPSSRYIYIYIQCIYIVYIYIYTLYQKGHWLSRPLTQPLDPSCCKHTPPAFMARSKSHAAPDLPLTYISIWMSSLYSDPHQPIKVRMHSKLNRVQYIICAITSTKSSLSTLLQVLSTKL